MQAWQFIGDGQPLTLNEVPEPVAVPGEIAIDALVAGLCHSDVGYLNRSIPSILCCSDCPRLLSEDHEMVELPRLVKGVAQQQPVLFLLTPICNLVVEACQLVPLLAGRAVEFL